MKADSAYLWLIIALALPGTAINAEVYKCRNAEGVISYSEQPCADGIRLDIATEPSGRPAGQGLRPGEKALLEALASEPDPEPVTIPPPAPESESIRCPGIIITAVEFYSYKETFADEIVDGLFVANVGRQQCARMQLSLRDYYGRLRDSVAEDLQTRLFAVLADGYTVTAASGELSDGPNRLGIRERYTGRFCFGVHDVPVVDLFCR